MKINLNHQFKNGDEYLYEEMTETVQNEIRREIFETLEKESNIDELKKSVITAFIAEKLVKEKRKIMTLKYVLEQSLVMPTQDRTAAVKRFSLLMTCHNAVDGIIDVPYDDILIMKEAIAERWSQTTEEENRKITKVLPLIYAQACGFLERGVE